MTVDPQRDIIVVTKWRVDEEGELIHSVPLTFIASNYATVGQFLEECANTIASM